MTQFGMEVGNRIADQIVRALRREVSVTEALAQAGGERGRARRSGGTVNSSLEIAR